MINKKDFKVISNKEYLSPYEKIKKSREQKCKIYKDLYTDYLYGFEHLPDKEKAVYYGIKYISYLNINTETSYRELLLINSDIYNINIMLKEIPYKKIINMFPIEKNYDGKKFECKDYFSTMEFLKDIDLELTPGENIYEFFFNYYNLEIINYSVKELLIMDKIRKHNYEKGLMEEFLEIIDPEHKITTYTIHEKEGYVYNNKTGKTQKLQKPKKRKKYSKFKIIK